MWRVCPGGGGREGMEGEGRGRRGEESGVVWGAIREVATIFEEARKGVVASTCCKKFSFFIPRFLFLLMCSFICLFQKKKKKKKKKNDYGLIINIDRPERRSLGGN